MRECGRRALAIDHANPAVVPWRSQLAHAREIAQALFVTMATVEFHLRNAYRKLGITSRTQLVGALRG